MLAVHKRVGLFFLSFVLVSSATLKVNEEFAKTVCARLCQAEKLSFKSGWYYDAEGMILSCLCKSGSDKTPFKDNMVDKFFNLRISDEQFKDKDVSTVLAAGVIDWFTDKSSGSLGSFSCDFPGNDIEPIKLFNHLECAKQCRQHPECWSFTYNNQTGLCWLKHSRLNGRINPRNTDTDNTFCGFFESYIQKFKKPDEEEEEGEGDEAGEGEEEEEEDVSTVLAAGVIDWTWDDSSRSFGSFSCDFPGSDIGSVRSFDNLQCAKQCRQHPECWSFTFNRQTNRCWLKDSPSNGRFNSQNTFTDDTFCGFLETPKFLDSDF